MLYFHAFLMRENLTTYGYIRQKQGRRKSLVIREVNKGDSDKKTHNADVSSLASSEISKKVKSIKKEVTWRQVFFGERRSKSLRTNQVAQLSEFSVDN